jgi:hypothetical protein
MEVKKMITCKPNGKRDRGQGRNGAGKADERRWTTITPVTLYEECSDWLTTFDGRLAQVMCQDLLGFEQALADPHVQPQLER